MKIIYILTYDCNFRCRYCDVHKRKESLSQEVIEASFTFLKENKIQIDGIKFFWGEPLLEKKKIYTIVNYFSKNNDIPFYLTTNASLIDDTFMNFVKEKNINTTFSIDGDEDSINENRINFSWEENVLDIVEKTKNYSNFIRVNQVVTSQNSIDFFKNFLFIYKLWVRNFNFLPEYYWEWTKEGLKNLKNGFDKIKDFTRDGNSFTLVNLENYSELTFFNIWIVIDTNGDIFATNMILSGKFEKYKKNLKIGTVFTWLLVDLWDEKLMKSYIFRIEEILKKEYPLSIIKSVKYIDSILNNFCYEF